MKSTGFFKGLIFINLLLLVFTFQAPITHSEDYYECPAHSSWGGDQCYCDSGYVSTDGSNCISEASICADYGPSHLVGTDCVCNDGYGVLDGSSKCQSLSAACAKYNAVWNAGINDCSCPNGTHLNESTGMCVSDAAKTPPPTPITTPSTTTTTTTTKPTTTSTATNNPTETTTATAPTTSTDSTGNISNNISTPTNNVLAEELKVVDILMADTYAKLDQSTQAVIAENQTIIPVIAEQEFVSAPDLYSATNNLSSLSFKEPITQSLSELNKTEQNEAKQQLAVLETFNNGNNEVQITSQSVIKKAHETFVDESYQEQLQNWQKEVKQAEINKKLKANADQKAFEDNLEMEQRLKIQIASLEKIIGYNHLRCLESTKRLQFDTMDKDYKAYFNNKAAEDMFEEAAEGIAFSKAAANANGASKQIRELKDELKRKYPSTWKNQYLDIPNKPNREKISQEDENIFKVFEKLRKQK